MKEPFDSKPTPPTGYYYYCSPCAQLIEILYNTILTIVLENYGPMRLFDLKKQPSIISLEKLDVFFLKSYNVI